MALLHLAREIILDLDAMGHILHGSRQGRFYSGYYGEYCYLPLYIFAGNIPLWAQPRTADKDAAAGAVEALICIVRGPIWKTSLNSRYSIWKAIG